MSGSIRDAWNAARPLVAGLHVISDNNNPLTVSPALLTPGAKIAPREWLYGTILVRKFVSVLISPGGIGKTSWSIAVGAAVASGRQLIGDYVHVQTNVLICSLEDPADELDRRLAACMQRHDLDAEDLDGRIFTLCGRERRLNIASLDADGLTVCYPDKDAIIACIRARKIGLVIVDPFLNSHELDENSNPHINAAARAWAEIASETGCAVLLIHHTRKGAIAGDPDSGRGASALVSAARSTMSLTAMSPEEAINFGIPENERKLYIRIDDAKANLAPPGEGTRWFHLSSVALNNGTHDYPKGDHVQAITQWTPPDFAKPQAAEIPQEALDTIAYEGARGSIFGPYAPRLAGDQPRSIAAVMAKLGIVKPAAQRAALQDLLARGFTVQEFRDGDGDKRKGLRSPEGTPEVRWLGSTPQCPPKNTPKLAQNTPKMPPRSLARAHAPSGRYPHFGVRGYYPPKHPRRRTCALAWSIFGGSVSSRKKSKIGGPPREPLRRGPGLPRGRRWIGASGLPRTARMIAMPDSPAASAANPEQFTMLVDVTRQALIEQADPDHVRLLVDILEDTFVPFSRASIICAMSSMIARYDLTCPQRGVVADSVRDLINEQARVLRLLIQPAEGTA